MTAPSPSLALRSFPRPDATRLYAEEDFTLEEMYDPEFSYSGIFHRICWECDEGKDPHGHGPNYSELNECSRGNRYVISGSAARGGAGRTSVDIHPLSLTHPLTPSLTHSLTHPLVHSHPAVC